jgi:hypothetical protein
MADKTFDYFAHDGTRIPMLAHDNGDGTYSMGSTATLSSGGDASAANQATQITAEQAILATAGATSGAKVITDANGTLQQYLRGLIYLLITAGQAKVTANAPKAATATSAIVTADGDALASNANRKAWSIQNLDDAAVYVKFGASASSSDFNVVLKAGAAANDGSGGFFSDSSYTGVVSIAAASGSPRVVVSEL